VARKWVVAGIGVAFTVLAGVFGGWGWALATAAVLLSLGSFFWAAGQAGSWMQAWSRRLYGGGRGQDRS
jgi:hypothetical protein